MKQAMAVGAMLLLLLVAGIADAAMYRCERDGQTIISDKPCPRKGLQGQSVDPTKPRPKGEEYEGLSLEPTGPATPDPASQAGLAAAADACRQYHAAMLAGDKPTLKLLATADRVAGIDQIPASSFSAMSKVMPVSIAASRVEGSVASGRAVVDLHSTSGRAVRGSCITMLEGDWWKVQKLEWMGH